jgi:ATP-dependent helicase HrpA
MDRQGAEWNRDGATRWSFDTLPAAVKTPSGSPAWPALVDQGDAVGLRLFDTADQAAVSHLEGVRRLLAISLKDKLGYLQKNHGIDAQCLLQWSPFGSAGQLLEDLAWISMCSVADGAAIAVRDGNAFAALVRDARAAIGGAFNGLAGHLATALDIIGALARALDSQLERLRPGAFEDLESQLHDLVYEGFLPDVGAARFEQYGRYLEAMRFRLERLEHHPARDAQMLARIKPYWDRYLRHIARGGEYDEALDDYRWLLEEYRVSLFAQHLGTAVKVSPKRLDGAWQMVSPPPEHSGRDRQAH